MTASKILFQFPGQGSQYRGMGSDLAGEYAVAREVYARASEVLGYDLGRLSFEDSDGKLDQTRYTQPALLAHEIACLAVFRELTGGSVTPVIAAGHSLGEYSALVAAGGLTLEAAIALVAERGRLMSELGRGSMLATTLDAASAKALADKHYCGVAGCNLPEQTVVAGEDADLAALAADLAATHKGKRAIELKTEGAFHTYWMVSAAQEFRSVLEAAEFGALDFGVKLHRRAWTMPAGSAPACSSSSSIRCAGSIACSRLSPRASTPLSSSAAGSAPARHRTRSALISRVSRKSP